MYSVIASCMRPIVSFENHVLGILDIHRKWGDRENNMQPTFPARCKPFKSPLNEQIVSLTAELECNINLDSREMHPQNTLHSLQLALCTYFLDTKFLIHHISVYLLCTRVSNCAQPHISCPAWWSESSQLWSVTTGPLYHALILSVFIWSLSVWLSGFLCV